jgi:hypothetical protein
MQLCAKESLSGPSNRLCRYRADFDLDPTDAVIWVKQVESRKLLEWLR